MFWSTQYAVPHLISIAAAIGLLFAAHAAPRVARTLYVALFAWACATNFRIAFERPSVYLEYSDLAVLDVYRIFINGLFAQHIQAIVGVIAACQGLIAAGLIVGGRPAYMALAGATVFLFAIAPLGVGSGFPATPIMAVGCLRLLLSGAPLARNLPTNLIHAFQARRVRTA